MNLRIAGLVPPPSTCGLLEDGAPEPAPPAYIISAAALAEPEKLQVVLRNSAEMGGVNIFNNL